MKNPCPLLYKKLLVLCFLLISGIISAQYAVTSPIVVNSFPHIETNVNTSDGVSALGMQGGCVAACCSTYVYKVTLPVDGFLYVEMNNFTPLAGSIIAYTSAVANPTGFNDLTYVQTLNGHNQYGNFCGFKDSLQLGTGYSFTHDTLTDIDKYAPAGDYYLLVFTQNQQTSQGNSTDITFRFAPACNDGYDCFVDNLSSCNKEGVSGITGTVYTQAGRYSDTISVAGGNDSVVNTTVTVNYKEYNQQILPDMAICIEDSVKLGAFTNYASYANLNKADEDWIDISATVPSISNTNRSIFAWIKKSATVSGSSQIIVAANSSSGGNVCALQIGTAEKVGVYDGSNSHYTNKVVTDGNWHHVGYTYDEATNQTKIYVDGVLEDTYTNSQSISATNKLSIGQEFDSGLSTGNFLEGIITEVSVWNEVLDSADVADMYVSSIHSGMAKYANLVGYYPMILNCGADTDTVFDQSSNGFHGYASASDIQTTDSLIQITGYNTARQFSQAWKANGSNISVADSITLGFQTYALEFSRDYFGITDTVVVSMGTGCALPDTMVWDGSSWTLGYLPVDTTNVVINSSTSPGTFTARNVIINDGFTLAINGGETVTIKGDVTNNGLGISGTGNLVFDQPDSTLNLIGKNHQFEGSVNITRYTTFNTNDSLTLIASSSSSYGTMLGRGTVTGDIAMQGYLDLPATPDNGRYYHLGSPLRDVVISDFRQGSAILNSANNNTGTIWEWNASTMNWVSPGSLASNVIQGYGYAIYTGTNSSGTFLRDGAGTIELRGRPRVWSNLNLSIYYNDGQSSAVSFAGGTDTADTQGWNLLANPYPAQIDWDVQAGLLPPQISNAYYVWDGTNYKTYINGAGNAGRYIAPFQGFFIQITDKNTGALTFPFREQTRTSSQSASLYKMANVLDGITLTVDDAKFTVHDELFVGFEANSTPQFDNSWDARKLTNGKGVPNISVQLSGQKYAVCRVPQSGPYSFPVNLDHSVVNDQLVISADLSGLSSFNQVMLEDHKTGSLQDLKQGSYSFTNDTAFGPHRFTLHFKNKTVSVTENTAYTKVPVYAFAKNGKIEVNLLDYEDVDITVVNTAGQVVCRTGKNKGVVSLPVSSTGFYIIRLTSPSLNHTIKLIK